MFIQVLKSFGTNRLKSHFECHHILDERTFFPFMNTCPLQMALFYHTQKDYGPQKLSYSTAFNGLEVQIGKCLDFAHKAIISGSRLFLTFIIGKNAKCRAQMKLIEK
jgi:hypothetical protein